MSNKPIDYDALAKQHGGVAAEDSVDYDALAKEHGGTVTPAPTSSVSAEKPWYSAAGMKARLYRAADVATESLPAAGATAGAIIGGTSGTAGAPGPGTVAGAIGGAGIGGMGGEALRQIVRRALGFEAPTTTAEAANEISKQGLIQGGTQAATEALPFAGPTLKKAALGQYERALAPTTKLNKAIVKDIAPEMVDRGLHGSLPALEEQAGQQVANLRPQLTAAYTDLEKKLAQRRPIRGLLRPAPTTIPLASVQAGEMPGALVSAQRPQIPESVFTPEARIARGDSELSRIRLTDPAYPEDPYRYYATGPEANLPPAPQPTAGVMQTRDPAIANQFAKIPPAASYNPAAIKGAGTQIIGDLDRMKSKYIVNGVPSNSAAINAIEGVQDVIRDHGPNISPTSLRQLKQIFDEAPAKAGAYAGTDLATHYTLKAQAAAANSIRNIVHSASPDIAALDKEISFWLDVQRVTRDSALRKTGQAGGLMKTLAPLGGAAAASTGLYLGGAHVGLESAGIVALTAMATKVVRSPAWRTASAVTKNSFADALARGDVGQVAALATRFGLAGVQSYQSTSQENPSKSPE